jgi:hypothetical protein
MEATQMAIEYDATSGCWTDGVIFVRAKVIRQWIQTTHLTTKTNIKATRGRLHIDDVKTYFETQVGA